MIQSKEVNTKVKSFYLNGSGGAHIGQAGDLNNNLSWHHINFKSTQGKKWLKKQSHLSRQALSTLAQIETRPRLYIEDDSIIMCLRGINFNNESQSPEDMIAIRIWMNEHSIITSSGRDSKSIAFIQNALKNGEGPKSVVELLFMLIEQLALLTDEFIDSLDTVLDKQEDEIKTTPFEEFNLKISSTRRQIVTIKRYLAPQKEALDKLFRSKTNYIKESFYDLLYIQIDKFIHLLENLELLRERALVLQEQYMTHISHQQNSRLYLLAIISAIFLPLTFLSGLLGMNVGGLPGLDSPSAFWLVSGFCLITTIVMLIIFKRSKWF